MLPAILKSDFEPRLIICWKIYRSSDERAADIEPVEVSTKPTREFSSVKVETPSSDDLELRPADAPVRYVSGKRVGFRSGPSATDPSIDRFEAGRQVPDGASGRLVENSR